MARSAAIGRIEDLRTDNTTNQNTDQLGYTDSAIQLHTDQPFLERPPRYQLLHCQQPAVSGGANFVVDALAAAHYLAELDRPAFDLLRTVPVTFHRKWRRGTARTTASPGWCGTSAISTGSSSRRVTSSTSIASLRLPEEPPFSKWASGDQGMTPCWRYHALTRVNMVASNGMALWV
jgi:alpha-ketoglutarate-dependent taurine dioxygenase